MKQKISNKTLRRILIPVMAVILVITVAANIGMNAFASVPPPLDYRSSTKAC